LGGRARESVDNSWWSSDQRASGCSQRSLSADLKLQLTIDHKECVDVALVNVWAVGFVRRVECVVQKRHLVQAQDQPTFSEHLSLIRSHENDLAHGNPPND
jgi:hypothetical protein